MSDEFSREYAENINVLVSLGISQEKQKLMEKGLKGDDILKKQRAVIVECRKRVTASKSGGTAR